METFGWDTIFVADIDIINASLKDFSSKTVEKIDAKLDGFAFKATLGDWQVVPGGGGKNVALEIKIASGTMAIGTGTPTKIDGVGITSKVALQLLPAPAGAGAQVLTFNFSGLGDAGSNAPITPISVALNGADLSKLQQEALGMALAETLVANAAKLSFVLANVEPMTGSGVDWLQPKSISYSYDVETGSGKQMLAIFAVNDDRPIDALPLTLDPAILSGGNDVGLAIAEPLFLEHVFAPAFAKSLSTTTANVQLNTSATLFAQAKELGKVAKTMPTIARKAFEEAQKKMELSASKISTRATLSLKSAAHLPRVKSGLIWYYPIVTSATASVQDAQINVSVHGTCDMGMGISMKFSSTSVIAAGYDTASKTISFSIIGKPTFNKDIDIPWYDHLFDLAGAIAEVILQVVVAAVGSGLANGINSITSSGAISRSATSVVTWAGDKPFTPTKGGLATAYFLQG